ncbi:MAG: alkaline phosphatase [Persicimonas sp.]
MNTSIRAFVVYALLACLIPACSSQKPTSAPQQEERAARESTGQQKKPAPTSVDKPKRIILLIGDGMGVPGLSAASYAKGEPLAMLGLEHTGLMSTHSHEFVTTDSAASATAIATGQKTHFEGVSVEAGTTRKTEGEESRHLQTVLEKAEKSGWKTGLVSTSRIVHATPAAFASHRAHRHSYEEIAGDMLGSGVDVLLGGGTRFFEERGDGKDLLEAFGDRGYKIARSAEEISEAAELADRLIGLPHDPDFPPAGDPDRAMNLDEMTRSALQVLDRDNDEGFFLMVEGSQIDWRGHDLDGEGVIKETLDFDDAVRVALDYASTRDDTLVVATSDHETGGLSVLDPGYTQRFSEALGGDDKIAEMTGWPEGSDHEAPAAALTAIELGSYGESAGFGPTHAQDNRLNTVFSHLTQASRRYCENPGEHSGLHTPAFVPIFAHGKASRHIAEAGDNAELGRRIKQMVGAETVSAHHPVRTKPGARANQRPRNIVVMVGDGMGIGALSSAYYGRGELAMRSLPVKGLVSTHAADRLVADSAAGATALASAGRTDSGAVGMVRTDDGLESKATLIERAEQQGKATGLVTTTTLTHATPAAFYAHMPSRADEQKAADSFVNFPERISGSDGIDIAFGAGRQIFGDERIAKLEERGVVVESTWSDEVPAGKQVVRFMGHKGLDSAADRHGDDDPATPTLRQMTRTALSALSKDDDGFVLMVEGGQIDWAQHGMKRDDDLFSEVADFDEAVAEVMEFARRDGETLVVVTADHDHTTTLIDDHYKFNECSCGAAVECGGDHELTKMPVAVDKVERNEGLEDTRLQGEYAPLEIAVQYAWLVQEGAPRAGEAGPHSANFVPLFAFGPHSDGLRGFRDLPEVGQHLQDALGDP